MYVISLLFVCFIDEAIKDLMTYYRTGFPEETITPKLHMLEHHVLDFIKRWRIGLGMYAEQGAESIHPEFNALIKRFAGMNSDEERIRSIFGEHHTKVRPQAKILAPEIEKRNFKVPREE